jgi:hypothetical protein
MMKRYMPRRVQRRGSKKEQCTEYKPMRCVACKAGGTLRKLDGKYLCVGCYEAVISERLRLDL